MQYTRLDQVDTISFSLTLTKSEAAALKTLLNDGYEWDSLGHDWDEFTTELARFAPEDVITVREWSCKKIKGVK